MNEIKLILQILFLFIIVNEISPNESTTPGETTTTPGETTTTPGETTTTPGETTTTPGETTTTPVETTTTPVETTTTPGGKASQEEKVICSQTQPLKGIKEECFKGNVLLHGETCCYMTIKYETNEHYECIAVKKDLSSIKETINDIKANYEGSKSINIDCNSSLIRLTLISFLLFFIF